MNELGVEKCQKRLLEMGKVIHKILTDNDIPYMIAFGTLLGAVRHKGFIPWDDDFDIFLFGDTYDKALEVLKLELPSDMFLETSETEPLYFHSWAHVKDVNTKCMCDQFPQDNIYSHNGLSIDLYVAYEMEEKDIDLFRLKENLKYQKRKLDCKLISEVQYLDVEKDLKLKIDIESRKVYEHNCKAFGMVLNERVMYPEEIFPLKEYIFEDTVFFGPADFDSMLNRFYGEYMQLPPEEKRIPHYSSVRYVESN